MANLILIDGSTYPFHPPHFPIYADPQQKEKNVLSLTEAKRGCNKLASFVKIKCKSHHSLSINLVMVQI